MTASLAAPQGPASGRAALRAQSWRMLARRSERLSRVRGALIAGCGVTVALLAGATIIHLLSTRLIAAESVLEGNNVVIKSPRFVGRTADRTRFVLTAERAERELGNEAAPLTLTAPALELADGGSVTARLGVWGPGSDGAAGAQRLSLSGDVRIKRGSGETGAAGQAVWTPDPDVLVLTGGVVIDRPSGEKASSQTAVWTASARTLQLDGGVTVTMKDAKATSRAAVLKAGTSEVTGSGGIQIVTSLGIATGDRYVYDTRAGRLQISGRARATLKPSGRQQ